MTLSEVREEIQAWSQLREIELRQKAGMVFTAANLISVGFHDPKKMPRSLQQVFPELFKRNQNDDWRLIKANMNIIKNIHNAKVKEGGNG